MEPCSRTEASDDKILILTRFTGYGHSLIYAVNNSSDKRATSHHNYCNKRCVVQIVYLCDAAVTRDRREMTRAQTQAAIGFCFVNEDKAYICAVL